MKLSRGVPVLLVTPDNPRLDGAKGVVVTPTGYGAVVGTGAAATGQFRALFSEMELLGGDVPNAVEVASEGGHHANGHAVSKPTTLPVNDLPTVVPAFHHAHMQVDVSTDTPVPGTLVVSLFPPEKERVGGVSQGYTGDVCHVCGGCRMRRSGTCEVCEDCGTTGGCG